MNLKPVKRQATMPAEPAKDQTVVAEGPATRVELIYMRWPWWWPLSI
jgi:hypothetical protein